MIQQVRHLVFREKNWHLTMKVRGCDLIKHGIRAEPLTSQKLEIGPQCGEFSGHGGALKTALMQVAEVGSNGMTIDAAQELAISGRCPFLCGKSLADSILHPMTPPIGWPLYSALSPKGRGFG